LTYCGITDQQELISRQAKITELELAVLKTTTESQQLGKELRELQALKSESHFELSTEIERLLRLSKDHEAARSTLALGNARLGSDMVNLQQELLVLRENFEKYRTRAQGVLSEKDALISRLKDHQLTGEEQKQDDELEQREIQLLR
jgi:hypothetical protein